VVNPALVGALYALFGAYTFVAKSLNAALGEGACVAAHLVYARFADRRGALLAASIVAEHPALLINTTALMTEAVAGSLWMCGAWFAVASPAFLESRTWLRPTLLGVVGAVATLVRPQMIVLSPVLGLMAARKVGWRALGLAAAVTALSLALCAPWTVRNCIRFDRCVFVSANSGWNLVIGSAEHAIGTWSPIETVGFPAECREVFGEADKDACFRRAALGEIERRPLRWLSLAPSKLAFTFDFGGAPGWYLHSSNPKAFDKQAKVALGVAETVVQRLVLLAALWALARSDGPGRRWRRIAFVVFGGFALSKAAWVAYLGVVFLSAWLGVRLWRNGPAAAAAAIVGATAVTHAVFFGAGRYSLVCYPALAALAGAALTSKRRAGDTGG
jgi:hypothetical protein